MLGERVRQRDPVGVAALAQLVLVGHRAGGGARAEQRAAEARALLVGPVDEAHGDRGLALLGEAAQHLDAAHDVEAAVEPAAVRHRVDVAADQQRALGRAAQREPLVARPRRSPPRRARAASFPRSHSRARSHVSVQATRWAPFSSPVSSWSSRSSSTVRDGVERHARILNVVRNAGVGDDPAAHLPHRHAARRPRCASGASTRATAGSGATRAGRAVRRRRPDDAAPPRDRRPARSSRHEHETSSCSTTSVHARALHGEGGGSSASASARSSASCSASSSRSSRSRGAA